MKASILALFAICATGCAASGVEYTPALNVPKGQSFLVAPSIVIGNGEATQGWVEVGKVKVELGGYQGEKECEAMLGEKARSVGAYYVRIIDHGRHFVLGSWSAPWCVGIGYRPPHKTDYGF